MTDQPLAPAAGLALEQLLGAWYVLLSTRSEWRAHTHPRVDHEGLTQVAGRPALRSSLWFHATDLLGRAKPRVTATLAVSEPGPPGWFEVRGPTLARVAHARFCVALLGERGRWAAVWHARSRLGTGAGLDVLTRAPSLTQAELDAILAELAAHPVLRSRAAGLYATTQHWFPPEPYRLTLPEP